MLGVGDAPSLMRSIVKGDGPGVRPRAGPGIGPGVGDREDPEIGSGGGPGVRLEYGVHHEVGPDVGLQLVALPGVGPLELGMSQTLVRE